MRNVMAAIWACEDNEEFLLVKDAVRSLNRRRRELGHETIVARVNSERHWLWIEEGDVGAEELDDLRNLKDQIDSYLEGI
jgi:hypothetical protein